LDRWTDPDGMGRGDWKLPPAECARVNRAIDDEIEVLFRAARKEGRREPRAAYGADALVNLVVRGPSKPPEVKVTIDEVAMRRGFVEAGDRCEIDGYGPVPVTVARSLIQDASVALLVRGEAGELVASTRAKRTIPRGLRRRLEHRYPVCANCGGDGPFEIDHIVPIECGGETTDDNTWRLCRHCHRLKTYFGWSVATKDRGRRKLVLPRSGGP
jgi:5-methylcytosine-specific restriction endonuclease McrA